MTAIIFAFIGGYATAKSIAAIKEYMKQPYRWMCTEPGCSFKFAISNEAVMEEIKQDHINHHELN